MRGGSERSRDGDSRDTRRGVFLRGAKVLGMSWEGLVTCGEGRGTKKNLDAFLVG